MKNSWIYILSVIFFSLARELLKKVEEKQPPPTKNSIKIASSNLSPPPFPQKKITLLDDVPPSSSSIRRKKEVLSGIKEIKNKKTSKKRKITAHLKGASSKKEIFLLAEILKKPPL